MSKCADQLCEWLQTRPTKMVKESLSQPITQGGSDDLFSPLEMWLFLNQILISFSTSEDLVTFILFQSKLLNSQSCTLPTHRANTPFLVRKFNLSRMN